MGVAAIAILTRHLYLTRYPDIFQPVLSDQAGVITRSAGNDLNLPGRIKDLLSAAAERFLKNMITQQAPFQGISNRPGLFVDFFLHEMAVFTQLCALTRLRAAVHGPLNYFAGFVTNLAIAPANICNIAVFKHLVFAGHRQQCVDIGRHKVFFTRPPKQKRRALAGRNKPARLAGMDHSQCKTAVQLRHRGTHRIRQIQPLLKVKIDLMHHDFRIGFGSKAETRRTLCIAKSFVIFNDAVAHERQSAVADMRMGIRLCDAAMRRPAGMGDSGCACQRCLTQRLFQFSDFADGSGPLEFSFGVDHHYPGGVIAPIFKPAQTFEQKAARFRSSDCPDNAAHKLVCSLGKLRKG